MSTLWLPNTDERRKRRTKEVQMMCSRRREQILREKNIIENRLFGFGHRAWYIHHAFDTVSLPRICLTLSCVPKHWLIAHSLVDKNEQIDSTPRNLYNIGKVLRISSNSKNFRRVLSILKIIY